MENCENCERLKTAYCDKCDKVFRNYYLESAKLDSFAKMESDEDED